MLSYELCLKLKESGWTQVPQCCDYSNDDPDHFKTTGCHHECDSPVRPILEELIEACGEDFAGLYRAYPHAAFPWKAQGYNKNGEICSVTDGDSAEGAVANLYLELNK